VEGDGRWKRVDRQTEWEVGDLPTGITTPTEFNVTWNSFASYLLSGQGFVVSVTVFARFCADVEAARRVARAAEMVKDFILKR